MDPDQLAKLVEESPHWAIEAHLEQLTPAQFDFCIRKEPKMGLYYSHICVELSAEHFDFCCRMAPAYALRCGRSLSLELLEFCCEKEPGIALTANHWGVPRLNLTKEQIKACCRKSPGDALTFVPDLMDDSLLKECARAEPAAALKFVGHRLGPALFAECAEAEPWEAITWCLVRLTDDELVRYVAGAIEAIQKLRSSDPGHPLLFRLNVLRERLAPNLAEAAHYAILNIVRFD